MRGRCLLGWGAGAVIAREFDEKVTELRWVFEESLGRVGGKGERGVLGAEGGMSCAVEESMLFIGDRVRWVSRVRAAAERAGDLSPAEGFDRKVVVDGSEA